MFFIALGVLNANNKQIQNCGMYFETLEIAIKTIAGLNSMRITNIYYIIFRISEKLPLDKNKLYPYIETK